MFSTRLQDVVSLLLLSGCMFLMALGNGYLFDEDEPKNAECGREMFARADWVVPTYNEELRTDKPIMLYWLMLSSFHVWGVGEFGARFPSACMAIATVLMVYQIGSKLFHQKTGWLAASILSSSLMYVVIGRISTPDSTLIAFTTLSLMLFVQFTPQETWQSPENATSVFRKGEWAVPSQWWQFLLMYAVMGLGVLTKGPVGFLLPCTIIGLFLLVNSVLASKHAEFETAASWKTNLFHYGKLAAQTFAPMRFLNALLSMRPILLFAVVCAVALPWYITVWNATDGAWVKGFLGNHNVGRFVDSMEGHSGPIFYYIPVIMMGFFPWSLSLPVMFYQLWTNRAGQVPNYALRFLCCWVGIYITFFSIAQTKLPNYVLPCYPALALLTSHFLLGWLQQEAKAVRWPRIAMLSLLISGAVVSVALPVASLFVLPDHTAVLALAGLPALIGGTLAYSWRENKTRMLQCWGGTAMGMCMIAFWIIAPTVSASQESVQLAKQSADRLSAQGALATYDYFAPNLPFYAERQVYRLHDTERLTNFWEQNKNAMVLIRSDHWESLQQELPFDLQIVSEQRRFLRRHDVYLVGRGDGQAVSEIAITPTETSIR